MLDPSFSFTITFKFLGLVFTPTVSRPILSVQASRPMANRTGGEETGKPNRREKGEMRRRVRRAIEGEE